VEVAYAFRDVASAREDRNRIINEAEGYRNTILPTTRGRAQSIISDAEGYSKERVERATGEADRFLALLEEYEKNKNLTASRIYIERMEQILPALTIYVLDKEDGRGVSNLRLMLPRQ
jgi:membrane protease subunit HflK